MYRHNQLKEELDKLRIENNSLKQQREYLIQKLARKDLQMELHLKEMSVQLLTSTKQQLFKTGLDTSTSKDKQVYTTSEIVNDKELFKEFCQNIWQIPDDLIDEILNNKK